MKILSLICNLRCNDTRTFWCVFGVHPRNRNQTFYWLWGILPDFFEEELILDFFFRLTELGKISEKPKALIFIRISIKYSFLAQNCIDLIGSAVLKCVQATQLNSIKNAAWSWQILNVRLAISLLLTSGHSFV